MINKTTTTQCYIDFCQNMQIPLIVCRHDFSVAYYNLYIPHIFDDSLQRELNLNATHIKLLAKGETFYSMIANKTYDFKLRWDLLSSDHEYYCFSIRIVTKYLKNTHMKLTSLFETLPISTFMKTAQGVYVYSNTYHNRLAGFDSLIGRSHYDAFGDEDGNKIAQNDLKLLQTKSSLFVYEHVHNALVLTMKFYTTIDGQDYIYGAALNMSKAHEALLASEVAQADAPDIDINLTESEIRCVNFMVKGHTASTIANQLNISHKTVEFHLDNAKRKLNCYKTSKLAFMIGKYHAHFMK
ncbi:PAS and helix-turn-helix domain-containing protein [Cysteiniphilum sp. JM-1]|uniref:PAS and helix-turn-helix domain-containing protein n=1 Tax=Cysteiniphilum sp. JM-1 TaxID=2610891 RepID=UPI001245F50C|nr:PAS and helix-turn-helix domain-containing protein [Cysteiniphilum sp. JM-1]